MVRVFVVSRAAGVVRLGGRPYDCKTGRVRIVSEAICYSVADKLRPGAGGLRLQRQLCE